MITATGRLEYFDKGWIVVWVDKDIANYYRALLPKYKYVHKPMYDPHITVYRPEEGPIKTEFWAKHQGILVPFEYNNQVVEGDLYYWLKVQSKTIGDIREELGLTRYRGDFDSYHITVGNIKNNV